MAQQYDLAAGDDIKGITVSSLYVWDLGFNHFPDVDMSEILEEVHVPYDVETTAESRTKTLTEITPAALRTPSVDLGIGSGDSSDGCQIQATVIIITMLFTTGIVSNLVGCLVTAANRKADRHYHNFLHIFMSNIFGLLPLLFTVAARFRGSWEFGDTYYKILSVVVSSAQSVCAFQLAYLVTIRSMEVVKGKEKPTNGRRKMVCYFIWLLALAFSWPTAIYGDIKADVIKSEPIWRSEGRSLFIKVDAVVNFISPGLIIIASLIFVVSRKKSQEIDIDSKTLSHLKTDFKVAGIFSCMFFVLWFPYRAWRIVTASHSEIPACEAPPDVYMCVAIVFSIIIPPIRIAITMKRKKAVARVDCEGEAEKLTTKKKTNAVLNNNNDEQSSLT